jgi:peptidoglycan/xylan/chitin deacetylase (PgdA/CDA1 family)
MTFALMYHDVVEPASRDAAGFPDAVASEYKLSPTDLEAHLRAMQRARVDVGLIRPPAPLPGAALTFDDGGAATLAAAEQLERYGWRGHFFVTTSLIDQNGFITASDLVELARRGHVVGSHSHTHPRAMVQLDDEALAMEWRKSGEILAALVGEWPRTASVPNGSWSERVLGAAESCGYRVVMTSDPVARTGRCGGVQIVGRYTIWSWTSARAAARYAGGDPLLRGAIWSSWRAKALAKRASPAVYTRLQNMRQRRRRKPAVGATTGGRSDGAKRPC